MTVSSSRFDVIIIGAGLAGMAASIALAGRSARIPLSVALIDARKAKSPTALKPDGRALAMTAGSRRMLETMGLWQSIEANAQPVERIEVIDARLGESYRPALLCFDKELIKGEPSAHMVESYSLYNVLYGAVRKTSAITLKMGEAVETRSFDAESAGVKLSDGTILTASLIIAADGRDSPSRKAAGLETIGWSYGQCGLVTTVEHERAHRATAVEKFLPAGPFAILPLPGHRSSLVWTESEAEADRLMALDNADYAMEINRRFDPRLGVARPVGPRRSHRLVLSIAKHYVAPRLALIGDAAHVVHPLAGLGFNLGLRDIEALAQEVMATARLGLDIGGTDALERYQRRRRFDAMKVALTTHGLNSLFSNENRFLRAVRRGGIAVVDHIAPLKKFLMRQAAGLDGSQPERPTGQSA